MLTGPASTGGGQAAPRGPAARRSLLTRARETWARLNWAILERWWWIVAYAVVGAFAFYWVLPLGEPLRVKLALPQAYKPWRYQWWFLWATAGAAIVGLFLLLSEPLGFRRPTLRFVIRYPPLWVALVLSFGLVAIIDTSPVLRPAAAPTEWGVGLPLCVLAGGAFTGLLLSRVRFNRARPVSRAVARGVFDWSSFAQWAAKEQPADEVDFFERQSLVNRISERLSRPWGQDETAAILGPFGSGKSTVLGWVRAQLAHSTDPHVWVCSVSCWGLEASATAPGHVLSRIIETVESFVDCRNLRGLPKNYQRFITAEPTGLANSILEGMSIRADPVEELQRLTPILRAANARLVLFIEDADRAGGDFDPHHIQKLLWMLRSVEGVSFVLAVDPEEARFDFSKVCDHIEVLPAVGPDQVRRVLRRLREHWFDDFDFLDPVVDRRQDKLDFGEAQGPLDAYARRRYANSIADAIASLLSTPRKLKHAARRADRAWSRLCGEIDPDDLLLAVVLREGAPECFDFLLRNMDGIRFRERDRLPGLAEPSAELEGKWNELLKRTASPKAVQALVSFLAFERLTRNEQTRPQGIQNDGPTDYFRRLLAEEIPPDELRDQEVLRDIDSWVGRGEGVLMPRLANCTDEEIRYGRVWEHFSDRMPEAALKALTEGLVASLKTRHGPKASGRHPAVLALWRTVCRRFERNADVARWIGRVICEALPVSLELANELYYFWTSVRHGPVDAAGRASIRRKFLGE